MTESSEIPNPKLQASSWEERTWWWFGKRVTIYRNYRRSYKLNWLRALARMLWTWWLWDCYDVVRYKFRRLVKADHRLLITDNCSLITTETRRPSAAATAEKIEDEHENEEDRE